MIVDLALTKGLKTFKTDTYVSYTCKSFRSLICWYLGNVTSTRLSAFCSPPDLKIFDLCIKLSLRRFFSSAVLKDMIPVQLRLKAFPMTRREYRVCVRPVNEHQLNQVDRAAKHLG